MYSKANALQVFWTAVPTIPAGSEENSASILLCYSFVLYEAKWTRKNQDRVEAGLVAAKAIISHIWTTVASEPDTNCYYMLLYSSRSVSRLPMMVTFKNIYKGLSIWSISYHPEISAYFFKPQRNCFYTDIVQ